MNMNTKMDKKTTMIFFQTIEDNNDDDDKYSDESEMRDRDEGK